MAGLSGWHLLILLAVVVLLFGAKRLPDMARAVGQSVRIFKGEMKGTAAEEHTRSQQQAPAASPTIDQPPHPVAPARLPAPPDHGIPDHGIPDHEIAAQQPTSDTTHPTTL
ncbi:MAG TPA: Sec-independent protein translocase subunit TatA [Pseudonocardiaceae bacterium]|jgi:sec-independent protein translocase protein TatA|nr:Sec-independent protein translocase subunit TatA [Pseudonocardiaceae bacterium]